MTPRKCHRSSQFYPFAKRHAFKFKPCSEPIIRVIMESQRSGSTPDNTQQKPLWRQLGPGLITAAVVIGPGTITVASKIGALAGTHLIWALVISGTFMMLFTSMAARIGVLNSQSILTLVAKQYGRWLSVVIGFLAFAVCAGFQSSNYLACSTALEAMTPIDEKSWMGLVGFAGLLFVFGPRRLYRTLEKVMMVLVGIMIICFVINLVVSIPNPLELINGLFPRPWDPTATGLVMAMVATTFSVIAALYQSTLAQQKGWKKEDLEVGVKESLVGISVLLGVSMMIMWTSATVLPGREIANAVDLANQLDPLLGDASVILFSLGFLAAGFSSTVVNAMIGGGLLADGFGLNADLNEKPARLLTGVAMVIGLLAGFYLLQKGSALGGIVVAQKSTILTVPLVAAVLILMANDNRIVGERKNNIWQNGWAIAALLILLAMSGYRIYEMLQGL